MQLKKYGADLWDAKMFEIFGAKEGDWALSCSRRIIKLPGSYAAVRAFKTPGPIGDHVRFSRRPHGRPQGPLDSICVWRFRCSSYTLPSFHCRTAVSSRRNECDAVRKPHVGFGSLILHSDAWHRQHPLTWVQVIIWPPHQPLKRLK